MNQVNTQTSQQPITVAAKEITSTLHFPPEIFRQIFSWLPISDRVNFAKTSDINLFIFYALSVLKGDSNQVEYRKLGMSAVIKIIFSPFIQIKDAPINDEYVPCTPNGQAYLQSEGIGGLRTVRQIQNGKPIQECLDNKVAIRNAFLKECFSLCESHHDNYRVDKNLTFIKRIDLAKKKLIDNDRCSGKGALNFHNHVFVGILMLEALSRLDHPLAANAESILNGWISSPKNRMWLVMQCAVEATTTEVVFSNNIDSSYVQTHGRSTIERIFHQQITLLLQDIKKYQVQGEKAFADKLVDQLINLGLALEYLGTTDKLAYMHEFCLNYFLLLSDNSCIDDAFKAQITIHQDRLRNKSSKALNNNNNTNCQTSGPFFPLTYKEYVEVSGKRPQDVAEHIKKTIVFFGNLFNAGCSQVYKDLSNLAEKTYCLAEEFAINDEKSAIILYECAEKAGDLNINCRHLTSLKLGAKYERLTLLKENTAAEFAYGKMNLFKVPPQYHIKVSREYPQYEAILSTAIDAFENAAEQGSVEADLILAQHYSTHTPNLPKFVSTHLYKTSDDKALEFMELAILSGFKGVAKEQIYKGEMPEYLRNIVQQIDSTAFEIIFQLSEKYENKLKLFQTEDDRKLATILLKIAVEGKNKQAIAKLDAQHAKLENELKIKLAQQIKV